MEAGDFDRHVRALVFLWQGEDVVLAGGQHDLLTLIRADHAEAAGVLGDERIGAAFARRRHSSTAGRMVAARRSPMSVFSSSEAVNPRGMLLQSNSLSCPRKGNSDGIQSGLQSSVFAIT